MLHYLMVNVTSAAETTFVLAAAVSQYLLLIERLIPTFGKDRRPRILTERAAFV